MNLDYERNLKEFNITAKSREKYQHLVIPKWLILYTHLLLEGGKNFQ